jgi:NitT/TauT family transport system permease protein
VSTRRDTWRERAITALIVIGVLAVWYAAAALVQGGDDPLANSKLPYPHVIVERFTDDFSEVMDSAWTSLSTALLGFAIGTAVALVLSVLMVQAAWVESAIMPYLLAAQMIPMIELVTIYQTVFKNDTATRLFIAAFITLFSVTVAVVRGLKSAPPPARELMRSYNAGRLRTLRYLDLPAALPMLFSGLRVAAPLSLVGSVLVDLMGGSMGLGYLMLAAQTFGPAQATLVWVAMFVLLALGFLLSQAVVMAERILAPWQPAMREGRS